ncbi:MAG: hypothetical protein M3130_02185, partial [Actinomycetota bacterium]|nr:hypothetical protein [Actinomycetota bacterium]
VLQPLPVADTAAGPSTSLPPPPPSAGMKIDVKAVDQARVNAPLAHRYFDTAPVRVTPEVPVPGRPA